MHLPNDSYPRLPYVPMIRELVRATPGIPVMALGRITDPAEAEGILAGGDIALIGLGRPLITDPAWPSKAKAGRAADIRYCVNNNTCWKIGVGHAPIVCDNNPRVALPDEVDFQPPPAPARRRIAVDWRRGGRSRGRLDGGCTGARCHGVRCIVGSRR